MVYYRIMVMVYIEFDKILIMDLVHYQNFGQYSEDLANHKLPWSVM